jgi:hypothetical protein
MDLKASCLPPERVLAVVKQRVVAAIGRRTVRADAIVDDVVRWCIEEYYRDDPRGGD